MKKFNFSYFGESSNELMIITKLLNQQLWRCNYKFGDRYNLQPSVVRINSTYYRRFNTNLFVIQNRCKNASQTLLSLYNLYFLKGKKWKIHIFPKN